MSKTQKKEEPVITTDTGYLENGIAVQRLTRDVASAAKTMTSDEARFLVDYYYICQDDRIRFHGQIRSMSESQEPNMVLKWLADQSEVLESQIKRALDKYTDSHPVGAWLKSLHGIGPVLAAGLVAHIDITQAPTAGHIWSYAGLVADKEWISRDNAAAWVKENGLDVEKAARDFNRNVIRLRAQASQDADGQPIEMTAKSLAAAISRRPWNAELKKLCWKIGECFVKFSRDEKCYYGMLFRQRKFMVEWVRNLQGLNAQQALYDKDLYGKTTDAWPWVNGCYKAEDIRKFVEAEVSMSPDDLKKLRGEPGSGQYMLPPAQIHARARRYAVKLLLSHLHEFWYETHYKRRVPKPFVIEHLGHVHRIAVPGYDSPYAVNEPPSMRFEIDPEAGNFKGRRQA